MVVGAQGNARASTCLERRMVFLEGFCYLQISICQSAFQTGKFVFREQAMRDVQTLLRQAAEWNARVAMKGSTMGVRWCRDAGLSTHLGDIEQLYSPVRAIAR